MSDTDTMVGFAPGVYDIPEDEYHRDPIPGGSLSVSGAKRLLPPSCPALFKYERDHGRPLKREFDIGHAAHKLILGVGPELHVVGGGDYKTKAVRAERDGAYAAGEVPVTPEEFDTVQAMAAAVRAHPRAGALFADGGAAEQSLFWPDPETGVMCRARLDWLSHRVVDYKTTTDVWPGHISRVVANFGYHLQAAFYLAGAVELDLVPDDAEFLFVFQSKTPPYLVTVVELDERALHIGRQRMRMALEIYRDCAAADVWPAYSDDIETIALPGWATRAHELEAW